MESMQEPQNKRHPHYVHNEEAPKPVTVPLRAHENKLLRMGVANKK